MSRVDFAKDDAAAEELLEPDKDDGLEKEEREAAAALREQFVATEDELRAARSVAANGSAAAIRSREVRATEEIAYWLATFARRHHSDA